MSEFNVCGVLVMASPTVSSGVADQLNALDGVEVHANDNGKIIVTVEGPNDKNFATKISEFSNIKGVLSTSLVYHEIDVDDANTLIG